VRNRARGALALGLSAALTAGVSVAAFAAPAHHRASGASFRVGIVEPGPVLDDHGFIELSYQGLVQAHKKLGVSISYVLTQGSGDYVPDLTRYAKEGYNMVIGISFEETSAVQTVAKEFPKTKFVLVDSTVSPVSGYPNVSNVIFDAQQGAYLAGALCGYIEADKSFHLPGLTHDGVVGVVGGIAEPPVNAYIAGFMAGYKHADPAGKVLTPVFVNSFTDVSGGEQATLTLHSEGADIVFPVAGDTGLGTIDAAKTHGFYALGVDANQSYLAPKNVLTSALKRVNVAVYDEIAAALHGTWHGGAIDYFSMAQGGVGMAAPMAGVPKSIIAKVNALKVEIENGKIKVPTTY
jgi:basic membrane protein A